VPHDATTLRRHLQAALDAESPTEKNFHVRQALQHCDTTAATSSPGEK
jgi:hypothetical protein